MKSATDPFIHHPGLRTKITDPEQSYFRAFTAERLFEEAPHLVRAAQWVSPDDVREANRMRALEGHRDADLWVFAYGSLMWDPAFCFAEVRRAHAPFHARRFILKDDFGARGTEETPGLMAALDSGAGCDGILFRITRDEIEAETQILWRREMFGPAYLPCFIDTIVDGEPLTALTFVADHQADTIDTTLTREEQIRFIATGTGFLGSSLEYLANIVDHFETLGIEDPDVAGLYRDVLAYIAAR